MRRKIILLGGMPTAGKTTIARQVSKHFDIPYISTDQIRTIMESVADPKVFPMLFSSGTYSAEEYRKIFSRRHCRYGV
jgi:2-phosphoglycerate kinase